MKLSKKEIRRFVGRYLQTDDLDGAAREIKQQDGIQLLMLPEVQEVLNEQRAALNGQCTRRDSIRRLTQLAFGRANDCVRLVLGETTDLDGLDLSLLSEIRRNEKGAVEVKLLNRLEVIDRLLTETEEQGGAAELLRALTETPPQGSDGACSS